MAVIFDAKIGKSDIAKMYDMFSNTTNQVFYLPYRLLIRTRGCPFWDSLLLLNKSNGEYYCLTIFLVIMISRPLLRVTTYNALDHAAVDIAEFPLVTVRLTNT
ncbi:hypothetical protein, partial [Hyphomonas sp.]|uniref:hypothetical protein n=1 Tax=Hyphomonas sp. TaxID=87 RepID=UPI0037BFF67C